MNTAAYLFVILFFTTDGVNVGAQSLQAESKAECVHLLEFAAEQAEARKDKVRVMAGCYKDLGQKSRES
jgi:hypothetical protein